MCGIFGYVGAKKTAPSMVLEGLKTLEYRGYDSWGIAEVPLAKNEIIIKKTIGKIGDATITDLPPSDIALGHTRWATHGGVSQINAHPHIDCTGTLAIIHNGIIENYEILKKQLIKKGHHFISETDTEVAVHLIEEYRKTTMLSKAVQKAFNDMEGLSAFIVLDALEHKFIAARNGSPLVIGFGSGENYLASDATALLPHTRQVHFLQDEQMAIVSEKGVMIFHAKTGEYIHPAKQTLDWDITAAQKGTYPFFMLKEIHEQPGIITDIAADTGPTDAMASLIKKSFGTYFIGCGTASYACLAGNYLFSKIAKRHVNWAVASEFSYQLDFLTEKSVVIALSQSGETMDTLEAIRQAKKHGARIGALINSPSSTLAREADQQILLGAGIEKGVASTKAFTAKIAYLTLLAYTLAGNQKAGQTVLLQAVKSAKKVTQPKTIELIQQVAKRLKQEQHMYIIGRGLSYPVALEAALKIKEISYIHAEGFAGGELKHGVLALIEKGTPCVAFLPQDESYQDTLAGAMEMKARGGMIIGISSQPHDMFDIYIPVPDAREATIIPNVMVAQLLAYYLTIERGFDPDKPRNLAKSVTVK